MAQIKITSQAFKEGEMIPTKYTCDGENISPQLLWTNIPENTKSFVLICDDPDAPIGTFVHWVIFNIPGNVRELPENFIIENAEYEEIKGGKNNFGKTEYGGPCPPGGTHRYYFKLYALDTLLDLKEGVSKKDVLKAIEGNVLGEGQLMGKYKR